MEKEELTPEEFTEEWVAEYSNKSRFLKDLKKVIRGELITFCCEKLSPDIIGDEVIFVDEYLKSQQK